MKEDYSNNNYTTVQIKRLIAIRKSKILEGDMLMIRIQALEWILGQIQDLILNNATRNGPYMTNNKNSSYFDFLN